MQEELISIIVPVYNVAPYLEECLESIAAQTYTTFECILIDDGSTDLSGAICDDFCRKDPRFRVIHQENAGVGFARNSGLDQARGAYIQFIDSDDVVLPGMLQAAMDVMNSDTCDWVSWDAARIDAHGNPIGAVHEVSSGTLIREYDADERLQHLTGLSGTLQMYASVLWNKLYARSLLGDLRFIHACYSEDFCFNYVLLRKTRQTAHLCQTLYFWRQRTGSATNANFGKQVLASVNNIVSLLSLTSPYEDTPFRWRLLRFIYRKLQTARYNLMGTDYYPELKVLFKDVRSHTLREYAATNNIPLVERLAILAIWPFPHIGKHIFKWLGN